MKSVKHRIRTGRKNNTRVVKLTPLTAIHVFCRECMGYKVSEIEKCVSVLCPLYPFRPKIEVKK